MKKHSLSLKLFFLIVATDFLESVADLIIKKGLNNLGVPMITLANVFEFVYKFCSSYLVWIGVFIYIVNFFILLVVLSKLDLSIAFPAGSTSYIFVPILVILFLKENVSLLRWSGIALIIYGIYFVSRSSRQA